jgi:hypothetical protein
VRACGEAANRPATGVDVGLNTSVSLDVAGEAQARHTPRLGDRPNNTSNHWKDNRVDSFYAHGAELSAAQVAGVLYGAGASNQTTPESDGGNLVAKQKAYVAAGGQPLCQ